jgi:hypothetical protein
LLLRLLRLQVDFSAMFGHRHDWTTPGFTPGPLKSSGLLQTGPGLATP